MNFEEGERYIVALRNLKDAGGRTLKAQPAFRALRDRKPDAAIEARRAHFEQLFSDARSGRGSSGRTSTWPGTSPSRAARA